MAKRISNSLLQPLERPTLLFLARRMPASVTSDALTLLGVVGAMLSFAGYLWARVNPDGLWLATFGLVVNWAGDSLDGTLARVRDRQRPRYGFYVDHVTDLYSQLFIGLGLALCGYVRPEAAGFALIAYLVTVAATHMAESVTGDLELSVMFIGPTEFRCAIAGLNALLYFAPPRPVVTWGVPLSVIDLLIFAVGLVALAAMAVRAFAQARQLGREDPPRGTAR